MQDFNRLSQSFSPNNFNKNDDITLEYFITNVSKMTECNSHETHNIYSNLNSVSLNAVPLNDQEQFRLNKINDIKGYFVAKIKGRELMSKRLSKYIASFDYIRKLLIA